LNVVENEQENSPCRNNIKSLEELIPAVIAAIGHDWKEVQGVIANSEVES